MILRNDLEQNMKDSRREFELVSRARVILVFFLGAVFRALFNDSTGSRKEIY